MAVAKSPDKNCFSVRGSHGQHSFFRFETESSVRSAKLVLTVRLSLTVSNYPCTKWAGFRTLLKPCNGDAGASHKTNGDGIIRTLFPQWEDCGVWLSPVERTVRVREAPSSNLGTPTAITKGHMDTKFLVPCGPRSQTLPTEVHTSGCDLAIKKRCRLILNHFRCLSIRFQHNQEPHR